MTSSATMVDIEHENEGSANAERGLRSRFSSAVAFLERLVADLDPDRLEGRDATALFDEAVRIERLGGAARLALAKRIESSGAFGNTGHRSAAELIAEHSGSDVGSARGTLELAQQLESCPATADALADGSLSALQAKEIVGAASLDPAKEAELIDTARRQPVKVLRHECRRVKATSAAEDQMGAFRRIHKGRYLRHWTDEEGAVCLKARFTADRGAKIAAVLDHEASVVFEQARKAGSREPLAAYAADALFGLLTSGSPAESPHVVVHVRVDHSALLRGETMPGEISEVAEAGAPLPIPIVSDLMTDAGIKVIFHHADDISKIYHFTRTINAPLRTALEERDPCCVVPGCGATRFLEIDHTEEYGQGGPTCLANTARLCHFHHRQKTNESYVLWRDDRMGWHLDPPAPFGEEEAYAERRRHSDDDPSRSLGGAGGDGAGASGVPPPQLPLE